MTEWVHECDQMRTFALERIKTLGVLDQHFEPRSVPAEPFANSLGAFFDDRSPSKSQSTPKSLTTLCHASGTARSRLTSTRTARFSCDCACAQ